MELSNKILSDITVFNKYAKFLPDKQRRETWNEICDRYQNMMIEKYSNLKDAIIHNMSFIRDKKILPSMRAMQFAGAAIKKNNSRLYNCAYLPVDDYRAFSEAMFLLLGGTGVGYSVQFHHVEMLPEVFKPTKERKYLIGDSLEGWADAIKALVKAYFGVTRYKPRFDFTDIRQKGVRLVTAGGKAPGPAPLRECLIKIEGIFEKYNTGDKLKPIDCHRIMCYIANSVLSGGIRRSACISLFSFDDKEMAECKYGNWWEKDEQFGRANNSAVIVRDKINKEEFLELWKKIEMSNAGEPGIYFTNDKDLGTNPCCFTGDMILLTPLGYKSFSDLAQEENMQLINHKGELVDGKVWSNGNKNTIKIRMSNGENITCTPDHKLVSIDGSQLEAKDSKGIRLKRFYEINQEITEYTKYGFIQGDGALGRLKSEDHKGIEIYFGEKDGDVAEIFGYSQSGKQYVNGFNEILKSLHFSSEQLPYRRVPDYITTWNTNDIAQFLKGLFSANGGVIKNTRISFKGTCKELIEDIKILLERYFNIDSYITTNKSKEIQFSNGLYRCKESYDLNISKYSSILLFAKYIAFVHKYKNEALEQILLNNSPKVMSIVDNGEQEVFDFNLDDEDHLGVVNGIIVHNCEISLRPFQFCNLTEVNVSDIKDQDDLEYRASVAAFFGTLQAGFTDFHYLRPVWKTTTEKEALIGVGMTGIASGKVLNMNLEETAKLVKATNAHVALEIGINKAARTTTIKPSGTTSCVLGVSSGIHAWHNDYYIRRMRIMKNDPLYTYLTIYHPELVEDDAMRTHDTAVISIPQKAPEGSILRDESALELLERVKKFNLEWVREGHRRGNNTNNVSATISIDNSIRQYITDEGLAGKRVTEWDLVGDWMWGNKATFNGLSVLPKDNGSYVQAPFTDCTKEEFEMMMSSLKDIDLSKVIEIDDNTEHSQEPSCAGGTCDIK